MQVQRTLKKREGVWGIVKGDKGETIIETQALRACYGK